MTSHWKLWLAAALLALYGGAVWAVKGKFAEAAQKAALEAQVALAEMREAFIAEAEASAAEVDAGGPLYAAEDVHAYIVARAAGRTASRPKPVRRARRR